MDEDLQLFEEIREHLKLFIYDAFGEDVKVEPKNVIFNYNGILVGDGPIIDEVERFGAKLEAVYEKIREHLPTFERISDGIDSLRYISIKENSNKENLEKTLGLMENVFHNIKEFRATGDLNYILEAFRIANSYSNGFEELIKDEYELPAAIVETFRHIEDVKENGGVADLILDANSLVYRLNKIDVNEFINFLHGIHSIVAPNESYEAFFPDDEEVRRAFNALYEIKPELEEILEMKAESIDGKVKELPKLYNIIFSNGKYEPSTDTVIINPNHSFETRYRSIVHELLHHVGFNSNSSVLKPLSEEEYLTELLTLAFLNYAEVSTYSNEVKIIDERNPYDKATLDAYGKDWNEIVDLYIEKVKNL